MKFETKAIRLQLQNTGEREHSAALYPTSSFVFDDAEQMRALFADELSGNIYSRFTNPNVRELEIKMAALEEAEDAVATASGMAAIFAACMGLLKSGDHIIATKALFGATHTLLTQYLPNWNITTTFVDGSDPASWDAAVRKESKMFFIETPSNPGLDIVDLKEANRFCDKHGLWFQVDNCFATPYLQVPSRFGAHMVTHSATKYIDGQGRTVGGLIAGKKDLIDIVRKFCRTTGPSLSPFNAWILSKSLETLSVRMDRHCENAIALATHLEGHLHTQQVKYPFLDSHPNVMIARQQMKKGGGIVTFELKGGVDQGRRFLDALKMISLTANLGDTRSIATHPASTTHAKMDPALRQASGISDGLIRISTGLEHIDDIIADLDQAIAISLA